MNRDTPISAGCELCAFNNPKGAVTAIIIRDGNVLALKRAEPPFEGQWDFPGGYMQAGESPEEAFRREIGEELGVQASIFPIAALPGTAFWKEKQFAVVSFFYLADIGEQMPRLNHENTGFSWLPIGALKPETLAFDSNQAMARLIRGKFCFDLGRVRELISTLDPTASFREQSLYRAVLGGHVEQVYDGQRLIGMGWIFPRQTLLRRQAVVEDMVVDEAYRGRGLGQTILGKLVAWAKDQGVEVVELTTNPRRVAANALYQSFGFALHPTNHYLYRIS